MSLISKSNIIRFKNRKQAGILLGEKLIHLVEKEPVVLAIPRGGVVVGREIAFRLNAELDLIITKKIGAPFNSELAIGSVAEDGSVYRNEELIKRLDISEEYIKEEAMVQLRNIKERTKIFSKYRSCILPKGKTVIITDDGIATGATMISAINCIKMKEPKSIFVALPVGPAETIYELLKIVKSVICLMKPEYFMAVGEFYEEFCQISDLEVIDTLREFSERKELSNKSRKHAFDV